MYKIALAHFSKVDPILHKAGLNIGPLSLRKSNDYFASLVYQIINQQLSEKAGDTIFAKFVALFPDKKLTAEIIHKTPHERLRSAGPSNGKIKFIKEIAAKIVAKELQLEKLEFLTDEDVISELTKLKGVGSWTAEMYLMFTLGREDVFSYGDLGLRRGLMKLYSLKREPSQKRALLLTKKWSPYRSYASMILWRI